MYAERRSWDGVFAVPEILDTIFSSLDKGDVFSCSLVCKTWSSTALNVLWGEMDGALDLFHSLNTFSFSHGDPAGELCMDGEPEPSAWPRWELYARRVRKFVYEDDLTPAQVEINESSSTMVSNSTWEHVSRTRPTSFLLPNLLHLHWMRNVKWPDQRSSGQLDACATLCSPFLKTLLLGVPSNDPGPFENLMKTLAFRCTLLEVLDLRTKLEISWWNSNHDPKISSNSVVDCLASLKNLKKLILPAFWLSTALVESLSSLPKLQVLQYELFFPERRGDPKDVIDFKPQLGEGAYPALEDLSLTASLPDLIYFFSSPNHPVNITELFLHSPNELPTVEEISSLLRTLSESLPHLVGLYLELRQDHPTSSDDNSFIAPTLTDLHSIQSMNHLKVFEFYYQYPLDATDVDIANFLDKLPSIHHLLLNCEPFESSHFHRHLLTLETIARHHPEIKVLGILLAVDPEVDGLQLSPPKSSFSRPIKLHVGASKIQPQNSPIVANWLSELCPYGCEIVAGYSWIPDAITPDWDPKNAETWNQINETIALLTQVKAMERQRREALEAEVRDLRTRTQVLIESASMRIGGVPA